MSAVHDEVITAAQLVPLSQAVEVNPKLDRSLLNDDLDVSFVPMAAVEALAGGIDVSTVRKYGEVKKGYTHFRDGDILFAKVTPCMENGKMAIARKLVNGVGFGSTEFHVLRPRAGVDARYIYYYVSSQAFRKEASSHMTGAVGLRRVPSACLKEQLIPLPSIEQQRKIVAELEKQFSRLDEAVANLQRVKANLKRYKASVLKDAVEGRLVPTEAELARREGRSFETGEQLLQRILETRRVEWRGKRNYREAVGPEVTDLPEVPQGWAWASPDQLSASEPYSLAIGPFGSSLKVSDYTTEGVPLVFVRNIRAVSFGGPETVYVTPDKAQELKAHIVEAGDILVTKMGAPPGDVCVYPATRPPAVITADCIKLRLTGEQFSTAFFAYAIESKLVQSQIQGITKGVAQLKVSLGNFSSIGFPLPPVAEQRRVLAEIDRRLSTVLSVKSEVDANLRRAQALRNSVLKRQFNLMEIGK